MPSPNESSSRSVVDSRPVGLVIVNRSGAFVIVKTAAARILGVPQTEPPGRGLRALFLRTPPTRPAW